MFFLGLGRLWGLSYMSEIVKTLTTNHVNHEKVKEVAVGVGVVKPKPGGLPRRIVQTGTLEPAERAEINTRVAGYIKSLKYELGEFVEKGSVIAEIEAEELLKDVDKHKAVVEQVESRLVQCNAKLNTAKANLIAADGEIQRSQADVERFIAEKAFHKKELTRISELVRRNAIEQKLEDAKQFELEAAVAQLEHAKASKIVSQAEYQSIQSLVDKAQADIVAAKADIKVAQADLERAQVMASYMVIVAPFSGVVTARNYDRGEYIQSAANGGKKPLVTLARIDQMRAVLKIPAPDVPFVHPGQHADVSVSALGGKVFAGKISRIARQQDKRTRTMRVEVDLSNDSRELAGGMYGAVTIEVPAPVNTLTIPVSSLIGRTLNGNARVYTLNKGRLFLTTIGVGRSFEDRIEVLNGLGEGHQVAVISEDVLPGIHDGSRAFALNQDQQDPTKVAKQPSSKVTQVKFTSVTSDPAVE